MTYPTPMDVAQTEDREANRLEDLSLAELNTRITDLSEKIGYLRGLRVAESEIERKVLDGDPDYLKWLDRLNRLAQAHIAEEELLREQQSMAHQADCDTH